MAAPIPTVTTFDDFFEFATPSKGRKRKPIPTDPGRGALKRARNSGIGKMPLIKCKHDAKTFCQASLLSQDDLQLNFEKFYDTPIKTEQDKHLLRQMTIEDIKRVRVKDETERQKKRSHSVAYNVQLKSSVRTVPVCKQTFMGIFGVSKDRLSRIAAYYVEHAESRPEKRGGCRHQDEKRQIRDAIKAHISKFMCRASHYGRKDQAGRKYLPSDLSVAIMHKLFQEINSNLKVSYALYYSVFKFDFNLGFGHPATDICSTCVSLKTTLKNLDISNPEKTVCAAELLLHRRRARSFYDLLNNVGDSVTVCFDIMENLVLPKSPIGQTYYSRQLYVYVMGIVLHHGKGSRQGKDEVSLYSWCEWQNRKDSNMVASALQHYLRNRIPQQLQNAHLLRLFSDACPGQNRNTTMLSMLFDTSKQFNISIQHHFPVRGHSFLPADRVFGRIDQELKKHDTVLMPEEYHDVLSHHGHVQIYGKDWEASDFKTSVASMLKQGKEFKISEAKVLHIKPDCEKVGFKSTYAGEPCIHSVLKRGKTWSMLAPRPLPHASTVTEAKKMDVLKLLESLACDNKIREFYEEVLAYTVESGD